MTHHILPLEYLRTLSKFPIILAYRLRGSIPRPSSAWIEEDCCDMKKDTPYEF